MRSRLRNIVVIGLFILVGFQKDAYAYLDPGSGSFIFQLLIAGLLGGIFLLKNFWKKSISALSGIFKKRSKEDR